MPTAARDRAATENMLSKEVRPAFPQPRSPLQMRMNIVSTCWSNDVKFILFIYRVGGVPSCAAVYGPWAAEEGPWAALNP